jgi:hypothetical protein
VNVPGYRACTVCTCGAMYVCVCVVRMCVCVCTYVCSHERMYARAFVFTGVSMNVCIIYVYTYGWMRDVWMYMDGWMDE